MVSKVGKQDLGVQPQWGPEWIVSGGIIGFSGASVCMFWVKKNW